jgi:tRNA1(Val) A37 N6-methylase TrmN6
VSDDAITEDTLLDGRLRLRQPARGHRAGTDALLLAAFAPAGGTIADFGSGVGTVGLALALRDRAVRVTLIEKQPALAALARDNIALNGLSGRVILSEADLLADGRGWRPDGLVEQSLDGVVTNPPFDPPTGRRSPDGGKAEAHVMQDAALAIWLKRAAQVLRTGGHFSMIHRADRLAAILAAWPKDLGAVRLLPVHPRQGDAATRLLIGAVKGSRAPMAVLPGFVLHGEDGRFTQAAEQVHRVGTGFPLR